MPRGAPGLDNPVEPVEPSLVQGVGEPAWLLKKVEALPREVEERRGELKLDPHKALRRVGVEVLY